MYKLEIYVTLKDDVLDPQGKAISQAAKSLNIKNILDIKQGKYFEVVLDYIKDKKSAMLLAKTLAEKLLCNEVIEDYRVLNIKKI